jgi:hypothetical protein
MEKYLKYKERYVKRIIGGAEEPVIPELMVEQPQRLGGFILEDPSKSREWINVDLFDTLNIPATEAIYNNTMSQELINKHLVTACLTLHAQNRNLQEQISKLRPQLDEVRSQT